MHFYDLPDVLIDYIFSFDDNAYYKQIYHHNMKLLLSIHNRIITNIYLSANHMYYNIYQKHMEKFIFRNELNRGQYILHGCKHFGVQIVRDILLPEDVKKANRLIQCDSS